MPRTYFPTPTSPKHMKYMQDQSKESSSFKNYSSAYRHYQDSTGSVSTASISTSTKSYDQTASDPWKENKSTLVPPLETRDELRTAVPQTSENPKPTEPHPMNAKRPSSKRIIPGVSKMNMRQTLAIIFSIYWDRADLYMDVLGLENDHPSDRELKLAFFRQGREVIATPIETPDDATMLTYGRAPFLKESGGSSTISVVQRGVPVSRKAKLKFQAIGLAYELLSDSFKRSMYDKWRLYNGRLPEPRSMSRSVRTNANERIRMQEATESPSSFAMHSVRSPIMESIHENEMDEFVQEHKSMLSAGNQSNVQSILRKSAGMRGQKTLNDASANSRKISWNEEVEELTLMEATSEDFLPANVPFVAFDEKRSNRNIPDPYGKSAEDWFGDVDNAWSTSVGSAFPQKNLSSKTKKPQHNHSSELTKRDRDEIQEKNIQSLQSNVLIGGFDDNFDSTCRYYDEPDDSFLVIMNGPWDGKHKQRHIKGVNREMPDKIEPLGDEWTHFSSDKGKNQNVSKDRCRNTNVKGTTVINQETPICAGTLKRKPRSSNRMQESSQDPSNNVPLTNVPVNLNDEDASLLTNPTVEDDSFDAEYESNDCNGIGHTVDIARGFQATLSKYITAAVEDMKEGLAIVGQNFDDLDNPDAPRKENKNFFTIEGFELDAMMGILKTEMDRFNGQFACGASDDAEYTPSSNSHKSFPLSNDKSFGSAYGTTVFKASPFSKPKKGIRKRLARIFSRKTKT